METVSEFLEAVGMAWGWQRIPLFGLLGGMGAMLLTSEFFLADRDMEAQSIQAQSGGASSAWL